jgi:hypothetical protein
MAGKNGTGKEHAADQAAPPSRMWAAIVKLRDLRIRAKRDEADLVKTRKKLEGDLDELGESLEVTETERWKSVASHLKLTERMIERARSEKAYYADKMEEAVALAIQGRLFKDEEFDELTAPRGLPDAPLYRDVIERANRVHGTVGEDDEGAELGGTPGGADELDEDDGEDEGGGDAPATPPAETPAAPAKPATLAVELGPDGLPVKEDALEVAIESLPVRPTASRILRDAGLITLNDFNRYMAETGGEWRRLGSGIVARDVEALIARTGQARREHAEKLAGAEARKRCGDDRLDRVMVEAVEGLSVKGRQALHTAGVHTLGQVQLRLVEGKTFLVDTLTVKDAKAVTRAMAIARSQCDDDGAVAASAVEAKSRRGRKAGAAG